MQAVMHIDKIYRTTAERQMLDVYAPEDAKNLDGTIKLVSDENFYEKIASGIPKDWIKELDQIVADIIGIDPEAPASKATPAPGTS